MTLLQKRDQARRQRRLVVFAETRRCLQSALGELIPGQRVIIFGSLVKPGVFNDRSDVDLALETEPLT
jgi:predicted nucleotidyltransferase